MITRIELENFKGIREPVILKLRRLTFLFGPNSAGKSTVIQALLYAFEVLLKGNLDAGTTTRGGAAVDLGGFRSLVHGHDVGRSIRIRLDFTLDGDLLDYVATEPVPRRPPPSEVLSRLRASARSRKSRSGAGARNVSGRGTPGGTLFEYEAKAADETPQLSPVFSEYVSQRARRAAVEIRVRWSAARQEPVVDRYRVRINGSSIGCVEASADGRGARLTKVNLDHRIFRDPQLPLFEEAVSPLVAVMNWHDALVTQGGIAVAGTEGALPLRAGRVRFEAPEDTGVAWPGVARVLRLVMLGPLEVLREQLEGLRYVGPLREVPGRHYQIAPTYEEGRWATGLAAWDALHRQSELRERTSRWLARRNRLGSGYELRLRRFMELSSEVRNRLVHDVGGGAYGDASGDGSGEGGGIGDGEGGGRGDGGGDARAALLRAPQHEKLVLVQLTSSKRDGELEVFPEDVGVGISQLVPVVAAAFDRQATALDGRRIRVSVVAIEQPELHVHPAIQVGIGDLLIAASKKHQLLIETHSEHIILRIQRRMRETNAKELKSSTLRLAPRKVAVLYLERTKDGTLRATPLGLGEDGKFVDPWPKGFFDERMKELF